MRERGVGCTLSSCNAGYLNVMFKQEICHKNEVEITAVRGKEEHRPLLDSLSYLQHRQTDRQTNVEHLNFILLLTVIAVVSTGMSDLNLCKAFGQNIVFG